MIKLIIFSCLFISLFNYGLSFNLDNSGQQLFNSRFRRSAITGSAAGKDVSKSESDGKVLGITLEQLNNLMRGGEAETALTSIIGQLQDMVKKVKTTTNGAVEKFMNGDFGSKAMKMLTNSASANPVAGLSKLLTKATSNPTTSSVAAQKRR